VRAAAVAVPLAAVFLAVTQAAHGRPATDVTAALAAVALLGGTAAIVAGKEGWAFAGTAVTLALAVATLFGDLWPNVLPSTTSPAFSLTVNNASSSHYTLAVMTWVALIFTPVVLACQGWTYWVFRKRLSRADFAATGGPAAAGLPPPRNPGPPGPRQRGGPGCSPGSIACRWAGTPQWAVTGSRCPAASASAWRWHGRCWPARRC
jgi:Cytochrome bd terminal oxidase subunit II